jgi:hypothetical protein
MLTSIDFTELTISCVGMNLFTGNKNEWIKTKFFRRGRSWVIKIKQLIYNLIVLCDENSSLCKISK